MGKEEKKYIPNLISLPDSMRKRKKNECERSNSNSGGKVNTQVKRYSLT